MLNWLSSKELKMVWGDDCIKCWFPVTGWTPESKKSEWGSSVHAERSGWWSSGGRLMRQFCMRSTSRTRPTLQGHQWHRLPPGGETTSKLQEERLGKRGGRESRERQRRRYRQHSGRKIKQAAVKALGSKLPPWPRKERTTAATMNTAHGLAALWAPCEVFHTYSLT